jgi:hypothetical protein
MKVDSDNAFFIYFTMIYEEIYNTRAAAGQCYIVVNSSLIGQPSDQCPLNIISQRLKNTTINPESQLSMCVHSNCNGNVRKELKADVLGLPTRRNALPCQDGQLGRMGYNYTLETQVDP